MACLIYLFVAAVFGLTFSQDCPLDYWGENCDRRCEIHCSSQVGCDRTFGACLWCDVGYWGSYCNHRCPENCEANKVGCRKTDGFCWNCNNQLYFEGFCNVSCSERWLNCRKCGSLSSKFCLKCYPGYWNTTCDNKCTEGCSECDINNGECLRCLPKLWGDNCSNPCSGENCVQCRLSDGLCERCDDGYWGNTCQNTWDLIGYENSICEKLTGACDSCKTGYWGSFCNNSCEILDCVSLVECSKQTGPKCYYCKKGKWGETCNKPCPDNCHADCKLSSGECITDYNVDPEDTTQLYYRIFGISLGTSFLVGILLLLVIFFGRILLAKRVKQQKHTGGVTNSLNANEVVDTKKKTEISSQPPTHCSDLNELEVIPQAMPSSGAIDDNGDYEHFVESVATTYDELSIEPPYEN